MSWVFLLLSALPTSGIRELLIPTSPLSAVYGESLVASHQRSAYLANPALAINATSPQLPSTYTHLSHTEWFAGTRWERVDFFYPAKEIGTLGVSASGFHIWDLEYRPHPDSAPETFPSYNTNFQLHYARMLGNFRLGMSLGGSYEKIYTYSVISGYLCAGTVYNLKHFHFGGSVTNLGLSSKPLGDVPWTSHAPLPARFQLGAAWEASEKLNMQAGISIGLDGTTEGTLGIGGILFEILDIYAGGGYGIRPYLGAGLGIDLKRLRLAYATAWHTHIGFSHHIGLEFIIPVKIEDDPFVTLRVETSQQFTEQGNTAMLSNDYRQALLFFEIALTWYPENTAAEDGYNEALAKENERQVILHLDAARNFRETGNYLDALREYEFVLTLDVGNSHALSGRADMLLELENMPILTQQDIPDKAVELFEQGVDAFRREKFYQALTAWQELEERYPHIEEIKPFIELASKRSDDWIDSLMVAAYDARGRDAYREAIELTEKILEIDPTEARAHTLREAVISIASRRTSELLDAAEADYEDHNYREATEKFNKVLAIDPENTKAKQYLERIKKEERLDRDALIQLDLSATTAYAAGDYDTAISIWTQILEIDSTFTNVERNLNRARHRKALLEGS
ncbi:hypothetical protein JXM67_03830 [candidate division WOR-3 bacterium]|nr:hypothetical protein [candidate division WOR-3 bacterium]